MRFSRAVVTATIMVALAVPVYAQSGQGAAPQGNDKSGDVKLDVTSFFASVDSGKDDKISKEEWVAAGLEEGIFKFFDQKSEGFFSKQTLADMSHPAAIDADKDGKMTLAEVMTFTKSLPKPDESKSASSPK
jgi:hypothetical protein